MKFEQSGAFIRLLTSLIERDFGKDFIFFNPEKFITGLFRIYLFFAQKNKKMFKR
jgi:hypothetical protein